MNLPGRNSACQGGSALALCLVLLLAFTALGVAMASNNQVQQHIQANESHTAEAVRNADIALATAERWLLSLPAGAQPAPCTAGCTATTGVWATDALPDQLPHLGSAWWQGFAHPVASVEAGTAYWLVAEVPGPPPGGLEAGNARYRVFGFGQDARLGAVTLTEALLARAWPDDPIADSEPDGASAHAACERLGVKPCGRQAWRRLR